ncbi:uncharacterized protein [Rutidosis leptorrhynchoides]|uniref:uncharacterized protein n=1 Tax=Rutidosis leptorrhynchoides TaxID=125765 RepID=UPI003A9A0656
MNSSSSSNSSHEFSNLNETNHVLRFNSPAISSGPNVTRSKVAKSRKQTPAYNPNKFNNNNLLDRGLGFSQFRSPYESVLFGVKSDVIVDDMSNLKIDSNKDCDNVSKENDAFNLKGVDESIVDQLPNEINKLKIESCSQVINNSNVEVELQNEMKKMNIKEPVDERNEVKSSVYDCSNLQATSKSEKMAEFAFSSKLGDIGAPSYVEFKTPDMKSNMFSGLNRFEGRKEFVKDTTRSKSKKKKGKSKPPVVSQSRVIEDFGFNRTGNLDTFETYSPMDISPCDDKLSRETSVTSDDGSQVNEQINVSSESHMMSSNVTTDDETCETESYKSAKENLECNSDSFVTALDTDVSSSATSGIQESVFNFVSKSENVSKGNFTFAAFSSSQSQLPSDARQHKKKLPLKFVRDTYSSSSAELIPIMGNSSLLSPANVDLPTSRLKKDNINLVNGQDFTHETVISSSSSKLAEEACEKWRLRGNQAYSNGDLAKAEDCYTQGLNSVSQNEKSGNCLKALMLCYSNRAAARISLGRMKEALGDCLMAATIDPNFVKVQVRAAHCYLAMGEIENAKTQYTKCLQLKADNNVDKKFLSEASEGLEKAQKVLECTKKCTDLFNRRSSEDLECALRVINEALQISSCSEKLHQMKAEALFMLRRYEQVIRVCEQTLTSDEVNTTTSSSPMVWKLHLIVRSYFYLGRLDEALEFINKQENSSHLNERAGNASEEPAIPLAGTIRELLSWKKAGNEAYKSGKHAEAVEQYTAALSCNVESRPFASICFCNRAAAYRGLGQITDAIADCCLAIALDPNYVKAISRRASLYEMIRDHGQASKDLRRLISLLTTQVEDKGDLSVALDRLSIINELKQTQLQLSNVEEQSRKGIPLNMYLILGVESAASAPDIKKAYRKAALRHHPDKVAQSLVRSDDGDDGIWKEIAENVHKDAERLFKMIGEAYAVLSNPSKRARYDEDEEARKETNKFTRSKSSRMATDVQNSVYERSASGYQWQDSWRPYGNTQYTDSEKKYGSSYRYSKY